MRKRLEKKALKILESIILLNQLSKIKEGLNEDLSKIAILCIILRAWLKSGSHLFGVTHGH